VAGYHTLVRPPQKAFINARNVTLYGTALLPSAKAAPSDSKGHSSHSPG